MHNRRPATLAAGTLRTPTPRAAGFTFAALVAMNLFASVQAQTLPTAPAARELSLQDCLNLAAKNNPAVATSRLAVDQALQNYNIAEQALRPSFTAGLHAEATSNPNVTLTNADNAVSNRAYEDATIGTKYTVWDSGRGKYAAEAARATIAATAALGTGDALTVLQQTSLAYYTSLHARNAVDIGVQNVKTAQQNLDATQTRYGVGTVTRADVLTATSALDSAKSDLELRRLDLQQAEAALTALIGIDPNQPLTLSGAQAPDWTRVDDTEKLIGEAESASPLRTQIAETRDAAESMLKSVKAERNPVLGITGELGDIATQRNGSSWSYRPYALIGAELTAPLFNNALQHAREQQQIDIVKTQDALLAQSTMQLRSQLAVDIAAYRTSSNRITIATDTVANAEQAYQFAQERYTVGKATEQDVVQALQLLSVARDEYQQAVDDRDTAAQNLRWLTGLDMPTNYIAAGAPIGTRH